jgi:hypothetical protein
VIVYDLRFKACANHEQGREIVLKRANATVLPATAWPVKRGPAAPQGKPIAVIFR